MQSTCEAQTKGAPVTPPHSPQGLGHDRNAHPQGSLPSLLPPPQAHSSGSGFFSPSFFKKDHFTTTALKANNIQSSTSCFCHSVLPLIRIAPYGELRSTHSMFLFNNVPTRFPVNGHLNYFQIPAIMKMSEVWSVCFLAHTCRAVPEYVPESRTAPLTHRVRKSSLQILKIFLLPKFTISFYCYRADIVTVEQIPGSTSTLHTLSV